MLSFVTQLARFDHNCHLRDHALRDHALRWLSIVKRDGLSMTVKPSPTGPIFGVVLAAILVIVIVATIAYIGAVLSSSGRGLDNDVWEVDHSVWMDQLHKDFEDSWKEQ